jgi:hypothetical protein
LPVLLKVRNESPSPPPLPYIKDPIPLLLQQVMGKRLYLFLYRIPVSFYHLQSFQFASQSTEHQCNSAVYSNNILTFSNSPTKPAQRQTFEVPSAREDTGVVTMAVTVVAPATGPEAPAATAPAITIPALAATGPDPADSAPGPAASAPDPAVTTLGPAASAPVPAATAPDPAATTPAAPWQESWEYERAAKRRQTQNPAARHQEMLYSSSRQSPYICTPKRAFQKAPPRWL